MTRLIYPKPQPERAWMTARWALWALPVAAGSTLVTAIYFVGWGKVILLAMMIALINWMEWRLQTVVTADEISVKGRLRNWILPVADIVEVQARNLAGDSVYVLTQAGRRRQLVKVKPENLFEISTLTGLPTRDYTSKG